MKEKAEISIIIPVYNTQKEQFKKCIDSILAQTLKEFEVIVVNDGSDAQHTKLIEEICALDSRIVLINKLNGGVSSARNAGIKKAEGEYILFVDSDDWIDENCLEICYEEAVKNEVDIVNFGYVKEFGNASVEVEVYQEDRLLYNSWKQEFDPYDMRSMGMCWMKLIKSKYVKKTMFDESLTNGEDVEFNFRLYSKVRSFVNVKEYMYHYRINENSAVRAFDKKALEKYEKTISALKKDVQEAKRKKKTLERAYYSFIGISYLVINMNYIFAKGNGLNRQQQMKLLKQISERNPYCEAIQKASSLQLPMTRKMALIFAKYDFYYGIYLIMMTKRYIDIYRNGKAGR